MKGVQKHNSSTPSSRLLLAPRRCSIGQILLAGRHLSETNLPAMPMRHWDLYSVVLVLSGRGRYEDITGRRLPLSPGDLMIMFPRHGYRYWVDPREPWSEVYVQFKGKVFDLWRDRGLILPDCPVHHLEPVSYWQDRLESVVAAESDGAPGDDLRRVCGLQQFLADAVAHGLSPKGAKQAWTTKAKRVLDALPFDQPVDWGEVASVFALSHDRFRKKFRLLTGQPPASYVMSRRIQEAGRILRSSKRPIKEVARLLGFSDVYHFTRRFAQHVGLPPARFRQIASRGAHEP